MVMSKLETDEEYYKRTGEFQDKPQPVKVIATEQPQPPEQPSLESRVAALEKTVKELSDLFKLLVNRVDRSDQLKQRLIGLVEDVSH